ncbi:MAG: amino acid adenylation domain-containing protein, partial [Chroococcidiopsidaceae cyanobacterium CP_BM_ER_R8_30]|nr:amino acid adenylation domain-containing protein [Chroococcidiopsidaceae cyanobacterium CP_BM_ER_R8_30]
TYRELNCQANQLAHHLQQLGVGPEVLVGICVERSLLMVVGLLAILKAGGAYVPLDPAYPQERLAFILEDAQASVLLTQKRLVTALPQRVARVVCLDADWKTIAQAGGENSVSHVRPEHMAYLIYTSGSTGKPKGVAIEHHSTVSLLKWAEQVFTLEELAGVLASTSICFDLSVFEVFVPLSWGGTVILVENALHLPALKTAQNVTLINMVPSAVQELLRIDGIPASVRTVNLAGEPLQNTLVQQLYQLNHIRQVFNLYGPSEDTTYSTCDRVKRGAEGIPFIGRPIANTQVYLLDSHLQPVPIGVLGELYIGGDGLARGYINRSELTADKFIPNPFSARPGARLYKTGDIARYLPDGNIEYVGRIDYQVKIRGFRIELGEIEAVLSQHPAILQTVVIAREDVPGNKRLVAYLVSNQEEAPTISDLRLYLKEHLPEYMVPSAFVMLDTLPLTPNGKVDRRALPVLVTGPSREASFVAPRTSTEEALATIWADVLRVEVGIHDNFFELGGDSILSILIVARANQAGLQLAPKQLFQYQTIAELAAVAGTTIAVTPEQDLITGPMPLTPIQHWFFEQKRSELHHFNQSVLLEVPPDLKPSLLPQVVQQLLMHHDALRLRFVQDGGHWQQTNATVDETVPVSVVDLSAMASDEQQAAVADVAAKLQASLNLTIGPLLRVALFQLGSDQPGRLLFIVHHLAVDGVSWRILLTDFANIYQQLSCGEAMQLPPKTTAFRDWAKRLAEYGQSEAVAAELDYWLVQSRRAGVSSLPVDYPSEKEANTVASAAQVTVALSVEQTRALLQEVPSAYNIRINEVLLTALVQSFNQWTGERGILFDLEGHGREELFEDVDLSRTVGWFTSIFPVWLELGEASHPGEALKSVKEQLRHIPHRGIGYGILRYLSQDAAVRWQLQTFPQAEVIFNYLGQFDLPQSESLGLRLAPESKGGEHSSKGRRSHLLEVNGLIVSGRLQLSWSYSKNIHQRVTIERLAFQFMEALKSLIIHCQSKDAGGYTPSDFSAARLNQKQLDKFIAKIEQTGRR